jgi:alpha-L-fucosidase
MTIPFSRRHFLKQAAATAAVGASAPLFPGLTTWAKQADTAQKSASGVPLPPAPAPIAAPPGFGVASGPFQPTWDSLASYKVPDWYRDAKFGIWAHWGPQCQPEMGDWYAQRMYQFGGPDYKYHVATYGHPSKFGFKDVINLWKAEDWDPAHLISLYKRAGAKYFVQLANHHDNFDNFDSKYQPWNSVAYGPKKDIVGGWAKATRDAGLRFAVSCHGDRAWSWYQAAQGADPSGDLAGVPYDGIMTKAEGAGKWWDGLDPQDLYAQYHVVGKYDWPQNGNPPVPPEFSEKFFHRTVDLIGKYHPDLVYFDDTILPIYPTSDIGLRIAAYYYNTNMARNGGKLEAVMTGKMLSADQRKCLLLDVERGVTNGGETLPWQTDTCIGSWHYDRRIFEQHKYKTAEQVSQMLIDIVSKNGNLQLSIPLPGRGVPDSDELAFLADFTAWMDVNSEGIHGTRPWKVYGEGPSVTNVAPKGQFGGAQDVRPYTSDDVRFTAKGDSVYAFIMGWPDSRSAVIKSLAKGSPQVGDRKIARVTLLGHGGKIDWTHDTQGLHVKLPAAPPSKYAVTLKIQGING